MNKKVLDGFSYGINQLRINQKEEAVKSIMAILGITTKAQYHNYRRGTQKLSVDKAVEIEKLFASYGIKECWGKA